MAFYNIHPLAFSGQRYLLARAGFITSPLTETNVGGTLVLEDFSLHLSVSFQDRMDLAAYLKTWATGWHDLPAALQAMGLSRENLPAHLQTVSWTSRDLATFLSAVMPLVFRDLGLTLTATDGTVTRDLATVLSAVKRAPQYRSVVAQRVSSVISEVN